MNFVKSISTTATLIKYYQTRSSEFCRVNAKYKYVKFVGPKFTGLYVCFFLCVSCTPRLVLRLRTLTKGAEKDNLEGGGLTPMTYPGLEHSGYRVVGAEY